MEIIVGKKKSGHWEVNDTSLTYYTRPFTFFSKPNLVFEANYTDIKHIEVYFTSTPMENSSQYKPNGYGHTIMFEVVFENGDIERFNIMTSLDKNDVRKAIDLLKSKNVQFIDKYNVLDVIYSNERTHDGIEKIIREYGLKYTGKKQ